MGSGVGMLARKIRLAVTVVVKSRPLNSHSFTVFHTVSLSFSGSHGRFFISHGFTNFEWILNRWHIPILLKKAFLVRLTKIKQAVAVLYL